MALNIRADCVSTGLTETRLVPGGEAANRPIQLGGAGASRSGDRQADKPGGKPDCAPTEPGPSRKHHFTTNKQACMFLGAKTGAACRRTREENQLSIATADCAEDCTPGYRPASASSRSDPPGTVVKSAARAIQILEFFDHIKREATVSEISGALRYPQSSTSILLRSLVTLGYLRHDRFRRTYLPSCRVSLLGNWLDSSVMQHGNLIALARDIPPEFGERVVLATINGLYAQYIYIQQSDRGGESEPPVSVGTLRPLFRTAVGAALLSTYNDVHVAKLARRVNAERLAGDEPVNISAFIAKLRTERRKTFFTGDGAAPGEIGVAVIARPTSSGDLIAIGVEGSEARMSARAEAIGVHFNRSLAALHANNREPRHQSSPADLRSIGQAAHA